MVGIKSECRSQSFRNRGRNQIGTPVGIDRNTHPDVVFKNVAGSVVNAIATGIDEFRELSERAKPFYSTRHEQIINIESAGETTIVDISFEGVFAADWNGVKAGDINKVKCRSVYEFLDEKIYKITDYS